MTESVKQSHRTPRADQSETAIEVLGDDYVCRILVALDTGPMPAIDLADACNMSRPTVYRRLNRLEALGFVTSRKKYESDGNHRKHFELVLDEIRFEVDEKGVTARVTAACC